MAPRTPWSTPSGQTPGIYQGNQSPTAETPRRARRCRSRRRSARMCQRIPLPNVAIFCFLPGCLLEVNEPCGASEPQFSDQAIQPIKRRRRRSVPRVRGRGGRSAGQCLQSLGIPGHLAKNTRPVDLVVWIAPRSRHLKRDGPSRQRVAPALTFDRRHRFGLRPTVRSGIGTLPPPFRRKRGASIRG